MRHECETEYEFKHTVMALLMTLPKKPFRITKICGLVNVENETAVYFRSYPPVFGSHMHVEINMTHFHTTPLSRCQ